MSNAEYMTVEELCQVLNIGKSKAYELVRENKITSCKIASKWMIPQDAVNEYVRTEINNRSAKKKDCNADLTSYDLQEGK